MKVHFLGAEQDLQVDTDYFRRIASAVEKCGDCFADSTCKCNAQEPGFDWNAIYRNNIEALARADVVITDVTTTNFALSYMTAIGLQYKKPTLILFRENAFDGMAALGLDESLVTVKEYDDSNLEEIITKFLKENRVDVKDMRFNFFIDRPIYNYLRWASYKTGKTKAMILRELVTREIERINATENL